jgi:BRO family, N-terminal domain
VVLSIADVILALTYTINVNDYIKKMRKRDPELNSNWGTFCPPLELMAPDGKRRKTQCANAENVLRIIQSIPSSKAEPFKRWLARVGYERLEEIEKRVRGIAIRDELTMNGLILSCRKGSIRHPRVIKQNRRLDSGQKTAGMTTC